MPKSVLGMESVLDARITVLATWNSIEQLRGLGYLSTRFRDWYLVEGIRKVLQEATTLHPKK